MKVANPPNKTRPAHHHHGDVVYFYIQGELHIEGEGVYRAGDVRWARAGHVYGPETTGPEGGSWWLVSSDDPIPVAVDEGAVDGGGTSASRAVVSTGPDVPRFDAPYDWDLIDATVRTRGGAVIVGLVDADLRGRFTAELDDWLRRHEGAGMPDSGSRVYDGFLGRNTLRLHGLVDKVAAVNDLVAHPEILSWARRMLAPVATDVLLNAGELIEIGPGEPAQYLHRDSDSWPNLPRGEHGVIVNAIVALTPFTAETGATNLALDSHTWEKSRRPDELSLALMESGDVLMFRGDIVHGGGANRTVNERRRGLSLSYCAGWLRPVENGVLNVPPHRAAALPAPVQALIGYAAHDATPFGGGLVGLYENGDPRRVLSQPAPKQ